MKVVDVPFGAVGIDCLEPIPPAVAAELATFVFPGTRTGLTYVERYLENLTAGEIAGIQAAGLGLTVYGEARVSGLDAASGASDGGRERQRAQVLGLPEGLYLGCDAESMACSTEDAIAYLAAWCGGPKAGKYPQRLYVGAGVPLTPQQLYDLPFTQYDESLSEVQRVAVVGYGSLQCFPTQTLALRSGPWPADVNIVRRDKHLPARALTMAVADSWGSP